MSHMFHADMLQF